MALLHVKGAGISQALAAAAAEQARWAKDASEERARAAAEQKRLADEVREPSNPVLYIQSSTCDLFACHPLASTQAAASLPAATLQCADALHERTQMLHPCLRTYRSSWLRHCWTCCCLSLSCYS